MSKWMRTRVIEEFIGFPINLALIVAECCMELRLLPWIERDRLDIQWLHSNPRALEAGWIDPRVENFWVSANPAARDTIIRDLETFVQHSPIWENAAVLEPLLESKYEIDPEYFSSNPHPKAVEMVIAGQVEMDISQFSGNPGAIEWLRANPGMIDNAAICRNPEAIDLIQELELLNGTLDVHCLSSNPHSWAIEKLRMNMKEIDWNLFSANPGIFEYAISNALVDTLTDKS